MSKTLVLQPRDLELFSYLLRHQVATVKQIQRDIFRSATVTRTFQRLRLMKEHGYLGRTHIPLEDKSLLTYFLEERGLLQILDPHTFERARPLLGRRLLYRHFHMIEVCRILGQSPRVKKILTSNELQVFEPVGLGEFQRAGCDAYLKLEMDGRDVDFAFYFAETKYLRPSFTSQVAAYLARPSIQGAIFCTDGESVQNKIERCSRELIKEGLPNFWFMDLKNFEDPKTTLKAIDFYGRTLHF